MSQLIQHHSHLIEVLEERSSADVVYLHFAKAFDIDKVDHGVLLRKLKNLSVGGKLLEWIKIFLTGRKQAVVVDGILSMRTEVVSGVPQGTVLVLILFHMGQILNSDRQLHRLL